MFAKKCTFLFIFLVIVANMSSNAYALIDSAGRFFIDFSQSGSIYSSIRIDQMVKEKNPDTQEEIETKHTNTFKIAGFKPKYQSSMSFGYKPPYSDFSYFFQYDSSELFYDNKNGKRIGSDLGGEAWFGFDSYTLNVQYDLLTFQYFGVFARLGFGFIQINQNRANTNGGYKLEFAYQGGLGLYYTMNEFIDFYLSYKFMANISTISDVSAIGYPTQYTYLDNSLYLSVRFNI